MSTEGQWQAVKVVVYRVTGRQGILRVPEWVCRECDLTVAAVGQACARVGMPLETITVRPWLAHLGEAWRAGARHPPAVLVMGRVYSQGVVPDVDALTEHLRRTLDASAQRGGSTD